MKIIKIISIESLFFQNGKFRSISTDENIGNESRYIIYMDSEMIGSISVVETEIRKMIFKIGIDEKYALEKVLHILEKKAFDRKMIKFFVYSDTKHTHQFEKMGFIKLKRFFDGNDNKYFKMFKII